MSSRRKRRSLFFFGGEGERKQKKEIMQNFFSIFSSLYARKHKRAQPRPQNHNTLSFRVSLFSFLFFFSFSLSLSLSLFEILTHFFLIASTGHLSNSAFGLSVSESCPAQVWQARGQGSTCDDGRHGAYVFMSSLVSFPRSGSWLVRLCQQ